MKNYDCPDTDVALMSRKETVEPPPEQDASTTCQAERDREPGTISATGRVWKSYQPWVVDQIDPQTGRLPITLYVRRDSRVWPVVARQGKPLRPPWMADR